MPVVQLPTILISGIGDSIMTPSFSGNDNPWFGNAVASVQVAYPAYYFVTDNVALGGTTTTQHWSSQVPVTVGNTPAHVQLKFACWFAWSPNDGTTGSNIQNSYDTYEAAFISLCRTNNFIPVLCTNYPDGSLALAADNVRLSVNNQVRALGSSTPGTVTLIADFDAVISDGASPARMISAYTTDGRHPYTAAGQAAMAPVLQNAITAYLAANGY
jgi:hypothetical protein